MSNKLYHLISALAVASSAGAQTTLPSAIYSLDFEGVSSAETIGAEQVGNGQFIQSSNENFGTYYQNNPEVEAGSHKNYLIVPTQGFINAQAKNPEAFSIGMWINAYVANASTVNHYYSTILSAYSQVNSYKTFSWPMFSARERQTLQINCAGWCDFTPGENNIGVNDESIAWSATKTYETGETDADGNPVMEDHGFEDNWHYVAFTFNGLNAKFYVDGEIKNEWNATANNYYFVQCMHNLDAIYLGDCGPFWNDNDGAYAFDDINFYACELTSDQQELIMNIKRGNIGDAERLVIAQGQLASVISDAGDYANELEMLGFSTLAQNLNDYLLEEIGSADEYQTIEAINEAIAKIGTLRSTDDEIVAAYNKANSIIGFYSDFCNNTVYAGSETFMAAIEKAKNAVTNQTEISPINTAINELEAAKIAYIFSQGTPGETTPIDVTRAIDNPWFCAESIEPTVNEDGTATYPVETPACEKGAWENSFSESLRGACDCTMYYTQGRTTWNNFHSSTVAGGILDVHQTITGLPEGYYTVTADMISNSEATDNHIYATSDNVTKVSEIFGGNGWDGISAGVGKWQELTTDKVLVGKDGTITIGATSTTDGTAYKGWYCVTNFRLAYYGTEINLSNDLAEKTEEVNSAITELKLKGDITNAQNALNAIAVSSKPLYDQISMLTDLLVTIRANIAKEQAFTALTTIEQLSASTSGELSKVYANGAANISSVLNSETASVNDLDSLNALFVAYTSYANTVSAAISWGTDVAGSEVVGQIQSLASETVATLANKSAALIMIMKSSVNEFAATEDVPKDITGLLVNPSFDNDSYAGWTVAQGTPANWYSECEFFNSNFDIFQQVEGLPAGTYRVSVQGYYRDGGRDTAVNNYNTITEAEDGTTSNAFTANAKLYANERVSDLMSLGADSIVDDENIATTHADGSAYAWYQPNGSTAESTEVLSYPDGMNAAQFCFDKGMYSGNSVDVILSEGETLKIGIRKGTTIDTDWTIFDNFKLFYLGQDIPTAIETADSTAEPVAIYNISGVSSQTYTKGVNIVKMSDGSVRKVIK